VHRIGPGPVLQSHSSSQPRPARVRTERRSRPRPPPHADVVGHSPPPLQSAPPSSRPPRAAHAAAAPCALSSRCPKEKLVPSSSRNCRQALAHFALPLTVRLCSKRRALATEHRPSAPASPPLGAQVLDLTPTAVGSSSARACRAPSRGPATPTIPWGHLHRYDLRPSSLPLPDLRADTLYLLSS
jgi:hypothetical protein